MGKTLFLECSSGISGDMSVAALLDLGGSREKLDHVLKSLHLPGFSYHIGRRKSCAVEGCSFDVILDHDHHHEHDHEHHHHDHEHHHHDHEHHHHDHEHHHHDHEHHHHDHEHHHHDHHHEHEHRNLAAVYEIINRGDMSARAGTLAKKIFAIIADAESIAHGIPVEDVHFHEVGAIDSIVDIVSAAVLIDDLDITDCIVTGISEGQGMIRCQHGLIPVPVPAVLNIASHWQIPLRPVPVEGELTTPTGIAIAAALRTAKKLPDSYTVEKTGIGTGKKEFPHANILRAMLIAEEETPEQIWLLESSIDDASGEMLGYAAEKISEAGALDVHFMPCFMKKGRPGYQLRVIAGSTMLEQMEKAIFKYTSTIGIRKQLLERSCMKREIIECAIPWGKVKIKHCIWEDVEKFYPEYESVKTLAESSGVDFKLVFETAQKAASSGR